MKRMGGRNQLELFFNAVPKSIKSKIEVAKSLLTNAHPVPIEAERINWYDRDFPGVRNYRVGIRANYPLVRHYRKTI